ncbi:toxin-antitoxin system HicB family antitoxin [Erysipelothrix rhusiopathiae]|nr:toxin-antitoxin system HicB family antitoxin [Erysipelothrix rhusiopathiae]
MANYKMVTYSIKSDEGIYWVAEYPSLPGVLGTDKDVEKAVLDLIENAKVHLEFLKEIGSEIPSEDALIEDNFSGRLTVRTSKKTHARIAYAAAQEGVSINQWINEAINYELGCETYRRVAMEPMLQEITQELVSLSNKSEKLFMESINQYKLRDEKEACGYLEVDKDAKNIYSTQSNWNH